MFGEKPIKSFIYKTLLYGVVSLDTAANRKYLKRFEMWCCRRMEKISCTDGGKN
jgi:hypothetical protein